MLWFGRRLPKRYEERNAAEARFRYGLMRLRDSADAIAIGGGERSERRAIDQTYQNLALRWLAVIRERAKLTWITNGSACWCRSCRCCWRPRNPLGRTHAWAA